MEKLKGLLIVNKPLNWTSMDVIRRVRKLTGIKKVGHAGTLDPLATGLLLVCISREATRHISKLMAQTKEYKTTINLTAFSETDDAEGALESVTSVTPPTREQIVKTLSSFIGKQEQIPPQYSAIKINGTAAYKLARKNKTFDLQPRTITIETIELIDYNWPELTISIVCSKGTYIRSLGRDIGNKLNTGGYLTKLIRTKNGQFTLNDAVAIENLTEINQAKLIPLE